MPDTITLILMLSLAAFFALLAGAIIAADQVVNLQKQANRRLDPLGFHWQFFTLTELPSSEAERQAKLVSLGQQKGILQGLAMDGHLAALMGLWILVRWSFYASAKKSALRQLAGPDSLSPDLVRALAQSLR